MKSLPKNTKPILEKFRRGLLRSSALMSVAIVSAVLTWVNPVFAAGAGLTFDGASSRWSTAADGTGGQVFNNLGAIWATDAAPDGTTRFLGGSTNGAGMHSFGLANQGIQASPNSAASFDLSAGAGGTGGASTDIDVGDHVKLVFNSFGNVNLQYLAAMGNVKKMDITDLGGGNKRIEVVLQVIDTVASESDPTGNAISAGAGLAFFTNRNADGSISAIPDQGRSIFQTDFFFNDIIAPNVSLGTGASIRAKGVNKVTGTFTGYLSEAYIKAAGLNPLSMGGSNDADVPEGFSFIQNGMVTINGETYYSYTLTNDSWSPHDLQFGQSSGVTTINTVIADQGANTTFSKAGSGTVILSGNNTFSGGTILDGGTLRLEHNNALGTGNLKILGSTVDYADGIDISNVIDLQNNATLNVTIGKATQSGSIGETGGSWGIEKTGDGSLVLTGTHTYTGLTKINAGVLLLTGGATTFAGALTNLAELSLQNNATNDSVATGNLTLGSGSTLKIDVDNANKSDRINVKGSVSLGGKLDVNAVGVEGDYPKGNDFDYSIITNDGSDAVIGNFASISTNFAFLTPVIDVTGGDGNDVTLNLHATNPDFKGFAGNANQRGAAKAMDEFDYSTTDGKLVNDAVLGLTKSQAEVALDQISGSDHQSTNGFGSRVSSAFNQIMMSRSSVNNSASSSSRASFSHSYASDEADKITDPAVYAIDGATVEYAAYSMYWAKAFGAHSSVDGGAGVSDISTNASGMAIGAEFRSIDSDWALGLSVGYTAAQFSTVYAGSSSKSDNYHAGLYALWGATESLQAGWGFAGALTYSYHDYESRRALTFGGLNRIAAADYSGYSFSGEVKLRYGINSTYGENNHFVWAPVAGFIFSNTRNDDYSEAGAGSLNITSTDAETNQAGSLLGLEFSNQVMIGSNQATTSLAIGWRHEFGDVNQINTYALQGSPTAFLAASPEEARDRLALGADIEFSVSDNSSLTFAVHGMTSETSEQYAGDILFKIYF